MVASVQRIIEDVNYYGPEETGTGEYDNAILQPSQLMAPGC